jgi:cytochrome c5
MAGTWHPHGASARREWPIDGGARRAGRQRAKRVAWVLVLAALAQPAQADEGQIVLKAGPGREHVTSRCQTCHSLDYIEMNAGFLDRAGWEKSVNKMIDVMHAPIPKDEVPAIVEYLTGSYGR